MDWISEAAAPATSRLAAPHCRAHTDISMDRAQVGEARGHDVPRMRGCPRCSSLESALRHERFCFGAFMLRSNLLLGMHGPGKKQSAMNLEQHHHLLWPGKADEMASSLYRSLAMSQVRI